MPDFAMSSFPGVKRFSGAFYYNEDDVSMINVPIAACEGGCILSADELKCYFGVEPSRMRKVPEYVIIPRLHSILDKTDTRSRYKTLAEMVINLDYFPADVSDDDKQAAKGAFTEALNNALAEEVPASEHCDITGEVVIYKPLAWVPVVCHKSAKLKNPVKHRFLRSEKMIQMSEIFGKCEGVTAMSTGGGWKGRKLELSNMSAKNKTSVKVKKESTETGTKGDVVTKEVVMGMCLRMERVYERSVHLFLDDKASDNSLSWLGCKSDRAPVPSSALRDVKHLQFHPISMTGDGHSSSLYMQALPVFGTNKELTDLHLLLSCEGWTHWYAYNGGITTVNSGRVDTLPLLGYQDPIATFIA